MNSYVALLRGINVGGHRVKMDALREHFAALGHTHVWTFIASGNVGFCTEHDDRVALRNEIEEHLATELGFEVATFLRTPEELGEVIAFTPSLPAGWDPEAASHYVIFLDTCPTASLTTGLSELESETDRFLSVGHEIHWLTRGKLSESPLFGSGIDRATKGLRTTTRNTTSLRRLVAKALTEEAKRTP